MDACSPSSLCHFLDPRKLAEKLPLVAQAPGVESGQEKLTPLCSSLIWPVGSIPWCSPGALGSGLHIPVSEQGFVRGSRRVGKPLWVCRRQGRARIWGQANELGWELPAYSWVAIYFAG